MQVFHARKHVFRVELFFEVIIGLRREPAFVTDLFERGGDGREFCAAAAKYIRFRFVKVKGHSGDKYNDLADRLAKDALGIQ